MKFKFFTLISGLMYASLALTQVSIDVQIAAPPIWAHEHIGSSRYYYFPEIEAYYDMQTSMFLFYERGIWIHHRNLPMRYRGYDLYHGRKHILKEYRGNAPYHHFAKHRNLYGRDFREQHNFHPAYNKKQNGQSFHKSKSRGHKRH